MRAAACWFGLVSAMAPLVVSAVEVEPLSKAAKALASELPAGAIVTAERHGNAEEVAAAGKPEPAGVPADRILFEIGSITKVFTSLLLAQAVVEKKVTLETTIADVLGKSAAFHDPKVGAITVRQLATHTSGLPRLPAELGTGADPQDPYAHFDRDKLTASVLKAELSGPGPLPPAYSNFGAGLLGDLLARVYGDPWEGLIAKKITGPLKMSDTVVTPNEEQRTRLAPPYRGAQPGAPWHLNALVGAGGLHSTAHDLLLFGEALLDFQKTPLGAAFTLLRQPQIKSGEMGLGVMIGELDGQRVYEHNGATGGFGSLWQVFPATRSIRIVLINNSALPTGQVLAAARHEKPRLTDSGRVLSEAEMSALEGVYRIDEHARFTVVRRGGELWTRLTGQPFFQLYPHELADRFFVKVVAAELQFKREGARVTAVTLHQNGREVPAMKTDAPAPALLFPKAEELEAFTGVYEMKASLVFTLKVANETLYAQLTGQTFLPVFATAPNRFEYDTVAAALEFERDAAGHVTGLKLYQNGAIQPAVKKR